MVVEGSRRGGERWAERVCGDTEGDCSQMSGDAVHGVTDWLGNLASVVAGKLDGVTRAASGGHRGADPDSVAATREEEPGVDDEAMGPPGERNEFEQRAFEIKVKQTSNRTRLHWILGRQYPVLGEQLMFMALRDEAKLREVVELRKKEGRDNKVFFTIDDELPYFPFCADFGPLNYGCVCKFTRMLNEKLATCSKQGKRLVLYTRAKLETRTNTATLLGCYLVMAHGYTPEEAWAPFEFENVRPFTTYRDASFDEETYHLTPIDVIRGMYKAKCNNIIDMDAFDAEFFDFLDDPNNADMHEVMTNKFVAFKGPKAETKFHEKIGLMDLAPDQYFGFLRQLNVSAVVRLNEPHYDAEVFRQAGFNHYDIYYDDCSTPDEGVLNKWFDACRAESGALVRWCFC